MWEIFEKLCQERGVTPYRVSEATGIKTSSLSGWKAGRFKPKQEKLQKIADYFGVSVEYLRTCASLFLANGVSVDTISRRLGHSDSKITKEIYLHMTGKLKQADEIALSRTVILP